MLTRVEFKIGCRWSKTTEKIKNKQTNKESIWQKLENKENIKKALQKTRNHLKSEGSRPNIYIII